MGHKNLCLDCRKTFNQGTDFHDIRKSTCPDCSKPMIQMSNRFRPPKKSDDLKWKVVNYLFDNGFYYQHIKNPNDNKYVVYPENLRDAREFVRKYLNQSLTEEQIKRIRGDI